MKVKICGITDVNTAVKAVEYGADAIGFVFAESKRRITEKPAREIVEHLPPEVYKVGVFVNETAEEIERIASYVGLTHIQLHGDEDAEFCQSLTFPVIKAISFQSNEHLAEVSRFPAAYILLDGPKGKYRGGNGTAFDWNQVNISLLKSKKVILAGGLQANNVENAVSIIKPFMVDVSSGVETDGVKDLEKIKAFIKKAKGIC
ncbi:phosphoribosylanthranilate isomerase [Neobacillus sp. OS1-32]|jgi:phosphoribosylanthranilate isomerase|uniref:N-(5'-phosphoribosyl)anthranilate isomerase n=1 Tax=Neobacillus paridis TaxID=2803862 RepID=A0ABS1TRF9_9BACI|nr:MULTISPECIES: phosphoribosylanthranilate isomerase [Neobacillus]MBL4953896.1 phosphoribosylanthranilate isomerase [Neobacillus paridis]WML31011.1 phosphoribosylanthranilate isomerase [Neobacillus sp. OS1-32]